MAINKKQVICFSISSDIEFGLRFQPGQLDYRDSTQGLTFRGGVKPPASSRDVKSEGSSRDLKSEGG